MVERFFTPEGVEQKISLKTKGVLERLLEGSSVDMDDYTPKVQNEVGLCYWYGHCHLSLSCITRFIICDRDVEELTK